MTDFLIPLFLVALYILLFDLFFGGIGLFLLRIFRTRSYRLTFFALRLLAMTYILHFLVPKKCPFDCATTKCGNWSCSLYNRKRNHR